VPSPICGVGDLPLHLTRETTITRLVVLLRGINVGKHNRIAMADLRTLLSDLGFTEVATLLNSGNAVITSPVDDPATVARRIEGAIEANLGLTIRTMVRDADRVAAAVERNPMPAEAERAPKFFHVGFCDPVPTEALARIDHGALGPDRFELDGDTLYAWFAEGVTNSPLARALSVRGLGENITLRNWNTVGKLLAMARR
jgi:uncharacterized protein (DUF1697 family)